MWQPRSMSDLRLFKSPILNYNGKMLLKSWGKSISNLEFYPHPTASEERGKVKIYPEMCV